MLAVAMMFMIPTSRDSFSVYITINLYHCVERCWVDDEEKKKHKMIQFDDAA